MAKLIYISNMRLPNERPHGIQIAKTCEALQKQGVDIELWAAARKKSEATDSRKIFEFYGIKIYFPIRFLPVFDFLPSWWKIGFYLESISFLFSAIFAVKRLDRDAVLYVRDEILTFLVFFTKKKIFWESHLLFRSEFLKKSRLKRLAGIVAISGSLKQLIGEKYHFGADKIIIAHDAVDLAQFGDALATGEARKLLNLPSNKKIAVYSGGLFKQKGVFVLLECGKLLPDWLFLIVGGNPGDETQNIKNFIAKNNLDNVILVGHVSQLEIKKYLAVADVLVLPNSNLDERTRLFTSPLKLFEYMASGRPIVASATPTIKEVLNEKNAILVESDSPEVLKNGLITALGAQAQILVRNARADVENYTWDKRAERISNFICNLSYKVSR